MRDSLTTAMDKQIPFSWVKNRKVQAGVYLVWSQEFFATYEIKKYFLM